jgi:glycosyltransferase involved in cell wall biosynthesis
MAMAKPVLSTRVGDIPNILAGTGYLADPSAPAQLAEQIRWIFQHPDEAMAKGIQARQRCVELYSVQAMGDMLAKALAGMPGY